MGCVHEYCVKSRCWNCVLTTFRGSWKHCWCTKRGSGDFGDSSGEDKETVNAH